MGGPTPVVSQPHTAGRDACAEFVDERLKIERRQLLRSHRSQNRTHVVVELPAVVGEGWWCEAASPASMRQSALAPRPTRAQSPVTSIAKGAAHKDAGRLILAPWEGTLCGVSMHFGLWP